MDRHARLAKAENGLYRDAMKGTCQLCGEELNLRTPGWTEHILEHGVDKRELERRGQVDFVKFALE